jgi:hypothetical protein
VQRCFTSMYVLILCWDTAAGKIESQNAPLHGASTLQTREQHDIRLDADWLTRHEHFWSWFSGKIRQSLRIEHQPGCAWSIPLGNVRSGPGFELPLWTVDGENKPGAANHSTDVILTNRSEIKIFAGLGVRVPVNCSTPRSTWRLGQF